MMNLLYILCCFVCIAAIYVVAAGLVPIDDWFAMAYDAVDDLDDDDLQSDFQFVVDNYAWAVYIFQGICVIFAVVGIVGALRYRPMLVFYCAMWYLVQGIASLFILGWGGLGIILASLWVYPNIMLYQEQLEGVMSELNYDNERYSCCCVGAPQREETTISEAVEKRLGVFA